MIMDICTINEVLTVYIASYFSGLYEKLTLRVCKQLYINGI